MPAGLASEPHLPDALALYLTCFFDLTNDRQVGMGGAGPIPFSAVDIWARRNGIAGDGFERLREVVGRLDAVWTEVRGEPGN